MTQMMRMHELITSTNWTEQIWLNDLMVILFVVPFFIVTAASFRSFFILVTVFTFMLFFFFPA